MTFDPKNDQHCQVKVFLERHQISHYLSLLITEGFDSLRSISEITEDDMESMQINEEHRQLLQREFAIQKEKPDSTSTAVYQESLDSDVCHSVDVGSSSNRRKYRRHPMPDSNAPTKPPSAYVMFSKDVRVRLKHQRLSFSELAKIAGNEWKSMDNEVRRAYERSAMQAKDEYVVRMEEYIRSPEYNVK